MTEADELTWHRDWRTRLRSAMRLWFNAEKYEEACRAVNNIRSILNEQPPSTTPDHLPLPKERNVA